MKQFSMPHSFLKKSIGNLKNTYWKKSENADSTDRVFDFLEGLSKHIQDQFDKIISKDTDKKQFIKALTCMFALLLNTKVDTTDKIKKILKIAIKTTFKIWQEQN